VDHLITKIVGCVCQVTHGRRTVFEYTNPHHTVVMNGAHLKITTYSCIKFQNDIFQLFLTKILDHDMQINSEIIKSFYA